MEARISQNINGYQSGLLSPYGNYFLGNVYINYGDNTSINHNYDAEQILSLMEKFLDKPSLTENALDELQEALGDEDIELKEKLQQAKDNNEDRKGIFSKAVERTKKAISTANDVHETMESGINVIKKIAENGGKIIQAAAPIIAVLSKYAGG